MTKLPAAAVLAGAFLMLSACGGGGGGGGGGFFPPVDVPDTGRGSLISNPPSSTAQLSTSQLTGALQASSAGRALLQVAGQPRCGIDVRYMEYRTVDAKGDIVNATGAVMVPSGSDANCSGARPMLLYAHGTTPARNYNLARFTDPAQPAASEGMMVAAMFAARGFIVVAPNYAGYDKSTLPYHPYLNGDQQGKEMADALRAARKALPDIGGQDAGSLLITGYSQGGYVAMAAHRELQARGQKVTASAPLSAPSAISLLVDYSFMGWPALGSTIFVPMLSTSWQRQFGDVYTATGDVYEAQYANGIDTLLPSDTPIATLFASGKLPQLALYPTDAKPGPIDRELAIFYGPNNLIRQSYLSQVANDLASTACPGNALQPTAESLASTKPLDCKPMTGFRRAAVANDLRNWTPQRPMLMCGGAKDPTVNFISTLATAGYFGAKGVPASLLTVLDLEGTGGQGDPFAAARSGLQAAKAALADSTQGSAEDKARAVTMAYHGTLVPPFCMAAARGFFEGVLAAGS